MIPASTSALPVSLESSPATPDVRAGRMSVATCPPAMGAGHCDWFPCTSSHSTAGPSRVGPCIPDSQSQCPASIKADSFYGSLEIAYDLTLLMPEQSAGDSAENAQSPANSTIAVDTRASIIAARKAHDPMSQRTSEPHLIAGALDDLIPVIRRKLKEDGNHDQEDAAILAQLTEISNRQFQHADVIDLTASMIRIGMNERNTRRLRDLTPALPVSAA